MPGSRVRLVALGSAFLGPLLPHHPDFATAFSTASLSHDFSPLFCVSAFLLSFALPAASSKYSFQIQQPRLQISLHPFREACSNSQLWVPAFLRGRGRGTSQRKNCKCCRQRNTPGRWLLRPQLSPGMLDWYQERPLVSEEEPEPGVWLQGAADVTR